MCILNLTELQRSKPRGGRKDHQEKKKREKAFPLFVLLSFMRRRNAWERNSKENERTRESKRRKEEEERSRQKQRERNKAAWHWGEKTKQNKTAEKRRGRKEKALRGKDRK